MEAVGVRVEDVVDGALGGRAAGGTDVARFVGVPARGHGEAEHGLGEEVRVLVEPLPPSLMSKGTGVVEVWRG